VLSLNTDWQQSYGPALAGFFCVNRRISLNVRFEWDFDLWPTVDNRPAPDDRRILPNSLRTPFQLKKRATIKPV